LKEEGKQIEMRRQNLEALEANAGGCGKPSMIPKRAFPRFSI